MAANAFEVDEIARTEILEPVAYRGMIVSSAKGTENEHRCG
jgi:hypothetical protein